MTTYVTRATEYEVQARRIAGTHAEKLDQIDAAVRELLDIKMLECAVSQPGVQFLAVPRPRSHTFGMTVTILALLILLAVVLGAGQPGTHRPGPEGPAYSSMKR